MTEDDWKLWRKIADIAYERFCEQRVAMIIECANIKEDAIDRFGKINAIAKDTQKKLDDAFGPIRRSTALQQLAYAVREGMVTREELSQFSEEAKQSVKAWLQE